MHSIVAVSCVWLSQFAPTQAPAPAKVETTNNERFIAAVLDEPAWSYPWGATPDEIVQHCNDYLTAHTALEHCRKSRILGARARAQRALGEYEKSLSDAREALAADSTNNRALSLAAWLTFGLTGNPEEVTKLAELNGADARVHALHANVLAFSDVGRALKASDAALRLAGSDLEALAYAHAVSMSCHIMNRDDRKALASADRAIEMIQYVSWYFEPCEMYATRATIHSRLGNVPEAIANFQTALRLSPNHWASLEGLWAFHLATGNYSDSMSAANAYSKSLHPGSSVFVRAVSLSRMRKTDEAIRLIETIPPESRGVALTIEYGIAHHFAGDHQAAKKIYESALKMSNCKALLTALSLLLSQTGDASEKRRAVELAEQAVNDPDYGSSAYLAVMLAHASVKDYSRAVSAGKVALGFAQLNPRLSTAITTAIGRYEKGLPSEFDMIFLQSLDITTFTSASLKQ